MSDKYCPAGKCECVYFDVESYNSPVCRHGAIVIFVDQIRRCPLPASPIKPNPFQICARDAKTLERINEAKASGRLAGLREAREGVEQLAETHPDINVNADNGWVKLSVILAVIDRLMGGK
jgi:hypothetical protein